MTEIERLREALLPCPFCGGKASFEAVGTRWTVGCNETNEDSEGGVFEILCYGYQSLTTFATQREAAAAWNRRAALGATPPGAERGEWKGIESAPTDTSPGNPVDLWLEPDPERQAQFTHPRAGRRGRRETDCWFNGSDGSGWRNAHAYNGRFRNDRATHWMRRPAPPSPPASEGEK